MAIVNDRGKTLVIRRAKAVVEVFTHAGPFPLDNRKHLSNTGMKEGDTKNSPDDKNLIPRRFDTPICFTHDLARHSDTDPGEATKPG